LLVTRKAISLIEDKFNKIYLASWEFYEKYI
jgi:hypothetical protein